MLRIGSHVSLSAPDMFLGSVKEALSYDANCLMVYSGAPQNTIRKPLSTFKIDEAKQLLDKNNFDLNNIVVHAAYIINLANPDEQKRLFAQTFLTQEVVRAAALFSNKIVIHPGSAVGKDRLQAIKWIAEGINVVIDKTPNLSVKILLETMAGKGNEIGKTFEEIRQIIDLVENKNRIGVCFDTCHVFDAGYDIVKNLSGVIDEFKKVIGINYLYAIHINDSKFGFDSKKDRHANIGFGQIGFNTLLNVCYEKEFEDIPKILETPYVDGKPAYKQEILMLKTKKFNTDAFKDL